jgi:hypothetical protein
MIAIAAMSSASAPRCDGILLSVACRFSRHSHFVKRLAAAAVPFALLK